MNAHTTPPADPLIATAQKCQMTTRSGRTIDLLNFDPAQLCDRDVAYALAQEIRWTSHAPGMTVAQHTVEVARLVGIGWDRGLARDVELPFSPSVPWEATRAELVLAAYLHHAPEAYLRDLSTPFKTALDRPTPLQETLMLYVKANGDLLEPYLRAMIEGVCEGGRYSSLHDPIARRIFQAYGIDPDLIHHPLLTVSDVQAARVEAISFTMGEGAGSPEEDPGAGGGFLSPEAYMATVAAAGDAPFNWDPITGRLKILTREQARRHFLVGLREAHAAVRRERGEVL